MSRSPRQTAAFSLFTFLDVMLCTLGALIIVLICVVRTAQIKNADEAPQTTAEIEDLVSQRETAEWGAKQLATSRDKARAQLQDRRLELSHVEEHSRRLRLQVVELEAAEAAVANDRKHDEKLDRLRGEVQRLAGLAAEAERDLDRTRREADSRRPSYAVVPYEGPSQTLRRPMYIECAADRIILQPENIELEPQDFGGPLGPGNPLAAGLRAAREFLLSYQSTSVGEPGEPYPLLLVRPDGVEAYYAAREAMSSWGSEFGYEFIDQDWKLEFREPQPAMVDAIRLAVDEARLRQRALARAAPRLRADKHASQWYRASPHGGVVQEGGPSDADDGQTGGWSGKRGRSGTRGGYAQADGSGREGWGRNGAASGSGPGRYAGGRGNGASGATGTSANGSPPDNDNDLASIYGAAASAGTGYMPGGSGLVPGAGTGGAFQGAAASGAASAPGMGNGTGTAMLPASAAPGAAGSFYGSDAGAPASGVASGQGAGGGGGAGDGPILNRGSAPAGGDSFAPGAAAAAQQPGFGGGPGDRLVGGLPAGAGGGGTSGDMTGGLVGNNAGSGGRAGAGFNQQPIGTGTSASNGGTAGASPGAAGAGGDNQGQPGPNVAGQMAGSTAANWPGAGQAGNPVTAGAQGGGGAGPGQAGGQAGQQGTGMLGKQPGGQSASSSSGQAGNPGGQAGMVSASTSANSAQAGGSAGSSNPSMQSGTPNLNMAFGAQPTATGSMANSRGKNWSLPEEARHAVPITRPVRLECRADKLVLRSEENPSQTKEFPLTDRTEDSVEDLVAAVWKRVETWGSAGRGMYWRPVLSVDVAPGASGRYADLQTLLADSGLDVKPAAQAPAQAARPKRKIVPW